MQPIFILCKDMFYDVIPCQTTSELHLYIDLTYHVILGHAKVCLSGTMTVIMIHMCCNDIMM